MNNPLDELGFDPNELIPYTGFNWDIIQGIDDVHKDTIKVVSRFAVEQAKRLDQVEAVVSSIGSRLQASAMPVIQSAQQTIADINQRAQSQLATSLSGVQAVVAYSPAQYALPDNYNHFLDDLPSISPCWKWTHWNLSIPDNPPNGPHAWSLIEPTLMQPGIPDVGARYANQYGMWAFWWEIIDAYKAKGMEPIWTGQQPYIKYCDTVEEIAPPPPPPITEDLPPPPPPPPPTNDGIAGSNWWIVYRWISCIVAEPQFEQWETPPSNRIAYGPFPNGQVLAVAFRQSSQASVYEAAQYQFELPYMLELEKQYLLVKQSGQDVSGIDIYSDPTYGLPKFTEVNFETCEPQPPPGPPTPPESDYPPSPLTQSGCPPTCPPIIDLTELVGVLKEIRDCICEESESTSDNGSSSNCSDDNALAYVLKGCAKTDMEKLFEDETIALNPLPGGETMGEALQWSIASAKGLESIQSNQEIIP